MGARLSPGGAGRRLARPDEPRLARYAQRDVSVCRLDEERRQLELRRRAEARLVGSTFYPGIHRIPRSETEPVGVERLLGLLGQDQHRTLGATTHAAHEIGHVLDRKV